MGSFELALNIVTDRHNKNCKICLPFLRFPLYQWGTWCKTREIFWNIPFKHACSVATHEMFCCVFYNLPDIFKLYSKKFYLSAEAVVGNVTDNMKMTERVSKAKIDSLKRSQRPAKVKSPRKWDRVRQLASFPPRHTKSDPWRAFFFEKEKCFSFVVLFLVLLLISHTNPVLLHVRHFFIKAGDRYKHVQWVAKG